MASVRQVPAVESNKEQQPMDPPTGVLSGVSGRSSLISSSSSLPPVVDNTVRQYYLVLMYIHVHNIVRQYYLMYVHALLLTHL